MSKKLTLLLALLALGLLSMPALAQDTEAEGDEPVGEVIEEILVVTASRTEQKLHDVPASITVIPADVIETTPADDYGDILRNVPGLNVTQIGTRDVQISSRTAASSLSTGQLVLVDGRTLYLDFFGFVIWEFLPSNTAEIKQIEVVKGPGSSVWGANAMQGVVNVITKSPSEMEGTYVQAGIGQLDTSFANVTHASANDKGGYKVSLGYYQQDEAYDRPTGLIRGTQTPYPDFENPGTTQPKIDLRYDWNSSDDTTWSISGGWAASDGLVHTGLGPFSVEDSTSLSYGKIGWSRLGMTVTAFANILDGEAPNLLTVGRDGRPLLLGFESQTYNVDFTDTSVIGGKHILTYGANARHSDYDLTLAPNEDNRQEFGVFLQDEFLVNDKFRWVFGARVDDIDPVGTVVSPRTTFMFSPNPDHTFRASYNQAYRAPSLIENNLDIAIISGVLPTQAIYDSSIAPLLPFPLPCEFVLSTCADQLLLTDSVGNPDLGEEQLEAFELGWVGTFDRTTVTLAVFRNELTEATDFFASENYTPFNVPADWPRFLLPLGPTIPAGAPLFSDVLLTVPRTFTYRNVGEITNQGVEFSVEMRPNRNWRTNINYTYADDPEVEGIDIAAVNRSPEHKFNLGVFYDADKYYVNGNVNYVSEAFWTDVLDARFHGPTDAFTQFNLGAGYRFNDMVTLSLVGSNILDERVQQHVFGDIISRKFTAELRLQF